MANVLESINPNDIPKRGSVSSDGEIPMEHQEIKNDLRLDYTTGGRFETPETLWWTSFKMKDVTDISLSDEYDILSNLLAILNRLKDNQLFDCYNMLGEEFIETLIYMKVRYDNSLHTHQWICDCQSRLPAEEQQVCKSEIDLKSLNFKTIAEADENLRKYYGEALKAMTPNEFNDYLKTKYGTPPKNHDVEKEIAAIKVKEPMIVKDGNNIFTFRFTRMFDLVEGQKKALRKHSGSLKRVQQEKFTNTSFVEQQAIKKEKSDFIRKQIAKDTLSFSKASSMLTKNGQELTFDQKVQEWDNLDKEAMYNLNAYTEIAEFGLCDERELQCQYCGENIRRVSSTRI